MCKLSSDGQYKTVLSYSGEEQGKFQIFQIPAQGLFPYIIHTDFQYLCTGSAQLQNNNPSNHEIKYVMLFFIISQTILYV